MAFVSQGLFSSNTFMSSGSFVESSFAFGAGPSMAIKHQISHPSIELIYESVSIMVLIILVSSPSSTFAQG